MNSADSAGHASTPPLLTAEQLDIAALLPVLKRALSEQLATLENPQLVGIATGGVWLAQWLHAELQLAGSVAELDSSFHRDDFDLQGRVPRVGGSAMPESLEGQDVVLIDDVLHTGRTIRAALNSLFEYGRPRQVKLLVLADRAGRELPVQADISACRVCLPASQRLRLVRKTESAAPLQLLIEELSDQ